MNQKGTCYCLYALRVGDAIDRAELRALLELAGKTTGTKKYEVAEVGMPHFFKESIGPIQITLSLTADERHRVGSCETRDLVKLSVFPFGVVSVRYEIPVEGEYSDLVNLSAALEKDANLEFHARQLVMELLEEIVDAVANPVVSEELEDYWVFQLSGDGLDVEKLATDFAVEIAQILNSENSKLSSQITSSVAKDLVAYTPDVGVFANWAAAIVVDSNPADVLAVIEVANATHVALRTIDSILDLALEGLTGVDATRVQEISEETRRAKQLKAGFGTLVSTLSDPLKLVRDQYLAKVFRLMFELHHIGLVDSISESFKAIDDHWEIATANQQARFSKGAEIIIIALIAIEIVLSMIRTH